jgi:hypothetical protein
MAVCTYARTTFAAVQFKQSCADLMLVELLFWKNARDAESVRSQYDYKVGQAPAEVARIECQFCPTSGAP